ncbi:hypothetical protein [Nocardiopsis composta]|uniref:Head-to-tail adaptor n=1 Tax=Nocardiopsis composta TaxID=157465 RepID=A0A7W8QJF1_9ACTN|nr:hypothetical protein [Nocardiopsis composta]MBB5431344.1 hypothetical protein [Nocardiopsis composta]
MQPVYATPEELAAHLGLGAPPPRAEVTLKRASRDVDVALIGAVYDVDASTQMPADPEVAEALRDAVLEQADYLIVAADPTGAKSRWESASIGQVSYRLRAGAAGETVAIARRAHDVLRLAGLLPATVVTY